MLPLGNLSAVTGRGAIRTALVAGAALLLAATVAGAAAQSSLYGPDAPSDVAFLRVVNASSSAIDVVVPDAAAGELPPGEGSRYVPVPGDEVGFEVRRGEGAEPETATPEVGSEQFATLLVDDEGSRVLTDEVLRDISRGLLTLVNATDAPLTLRMADGTTIFEDVGPEPTSRTIAEAEAILEVVDPASGDLVGSLESRLLERGTAHTILVYDGPEGPAVSYLAASLAD